MGGRVGQGPSWSGAEFVRGRDVQLQPQLASDTPRPLYGPKIPSQPSIYPRYIDWKPAILETCQCYSHILRKEI